MLYFLQSVHLIVEVKDVQSTLSPGGGRILCSNHIIQSTPRAVENTIASCLISFHYSDRISSSCLIHRQGVLRLYLGMDFGGRTDDDLVLIRILYGPPHRISDIIRAPEG